MNLQPVSRHLDNQEYLEAHTRWRNESLKWTRENKKTTVKEQKKFFQNLPKDSLYFAVVSRGTIVGTVGLTDINLTHETAQFSLLIGSEYRRMGYGSKALHELLIYAFNDLKLHLVYGETFQYPDGTINPGAKAYEKLGFTYEGVLRERFFKDGERVNCLMYAITKDHFLGL